MSEILNNYVHAVELGQTGDQLEELETGVVNSFSTIYKLDDFYNHLNMDNIMKIVDRVDFDEFEDVLSVIKTLLNKSTAAHPRDSVLLLNALHCSHFSYLDCISLMEYFTNSDVCKMIALFASLPNIDYDQRIHDLEEQNRRLKQNTKYPPLTEKPVFQRPLRYRERLINAACDGNLLNIRYLIENEHNDPNTRFNDGDTSLHIACWNGYIDVVIYLVEFCKVDSRAKTYAGETPLFCACEKGKIEVVRYLVENVKVNPYTEDKCHNTSLSIAVKNGHFEIVQYLVRNCKLDVNQMHFSKASPFLIACMNGHCNIARFLLGNGARFDVTDINGCNAIQLAAKYGHLNMFKNLCGNNPLSMNHVSDAGIIHMKRAIHYAARNGHIDIVKYIVNNGVPANINDNFGKNPLHYACKNGNISIVEFLIGHGSNINAPDLKGMTPVFYAIKCGHLDLVKFLIGHGADKNFKDSLGRSPLSYAARCGNLEIVQYLVSQNVEKDINDNLPTTPAHEACASSNIQVIKYLIEKQGYDTKLKTQTQQTLLHYAFKVLDNSNFPLMTRIIRYLIEDKHMDPNSTDNMGVAPIHIVCENGSVDGLHLLLSYNVKLDIKDKNGNTTLHKATEFVCRHYPRCNSDIQFIKLLLLNHANKNIRNNDSKTPLEFALWEGCSDVAKYIRDH